jgi:hypothetical protein
MELVAMPKMKNQDVIEQFVNYNIQPNIESHTGNLYITMSGRKLMNYNTVLAQRVGNDLIINSTKYSVTTSKIQTWLRRAAYNFIETTKHVPINTNDLKEYV